MGAEAGVRSPHQSNWLGLRKEAFEAVGAEAADLWQSECSDNYTDKPYVSQTGTQVHQNV